MKKLLIILGISLNLFSCNDPNGYPRIEDQEQLSPVYRYVNIDGKMYVDIERSFCIARTYRISKGYVGPVSEPIRLNLSECDRIIGRAPDEYGVFATWLENFRNWLLGF